MGGALVVWGERLVKERELPDQVRPADPNNATQAGGKTVTLNADQLAAAEVAEPGTARRTLV